jgi:opacity protein-like surface antigen
MTRNLLLAGAALLLAAAAGSAQAADVAVKAPPPAVVAVAERCDDFYLGYRRSFGWGHTGFGFGAFEGALPRYPANEFPNWYGLCPTPGHYSASGTAFGLTGSVK